MANGTINGVTSNNYVQARIVWTSESNVATNTSHVTATFQLYKDSTYASRTYGTGSWQLSIGDSSVAKQVTVTLYSGAGWVTILSLNADIPHNADGTRSITLSASGGISGTTLSSVTCSRTVALDNIARASTLIPNQNTVTAGQSFDFTIERAGTTFTHKARFCIGTFCAEKDLGSAMQGSFSVPVDWCNALPNTDRGTLTCTLETYSNGTLIGTKDASLTLLVPGSVLPVLSSVQCEAVGGAFGLFLQNRSKAKFTFAAEGATGSTIAAYVVAGVATSTQNVITSSLLSSAGNVSFKCYVIDSRGRQSASITRQIEVHSYQPPTLHASAYRCDADGSPDSDGTYLLVQADYACSSLAGNNSASCTVVYRPTNVQTYSEAHCLQNGISAVIGGNVDVSSSYEVLFTLTDALPSTVTYTSPISPSFRLINANGASGGIAFGRMSTKRAMQCALDADFEGALRVAGNVQSDGDLTVGGALYISGNAMRALSLCFMPVGYIYISRNATDPGELFGGTWQRLENVFLLAASNTYPVGTTGGEAEHTLTTDEMPAHNHKYYGAYTNLTAGSIVMPELYRYTKGSTHALDGSFTGVGKAHNNMPPYLALYMWERIA